MAKHGVVWRNSCTAPKHGVVWRNSCTAIRVVLYANTKAFNHRSQLSCTPGPLGLSMAVRVLWKRSTGFMDFLSHVWNWPLLIFSTYSGIMETPSLLILCPRYSTWDWNSLVFAKRADKCAHLAPRFDSQHVISSTCI